MRNIVRLSSWFICCARAGVRETVGIQAGDSTHSSATQMADDEFVVRRESVVVGIGLHFSQQLPCLLRGYIVTGLLHFFAKDVCIGARGTAL
jgi:hypothetical protein